MEHPKLLMVTQGTFNSLSGTGITFTNLFKGWPKDKIAVIHQDRVEPDTSVCDTYYKLSSSEMPDTWPYSMRQRVIRAQKKSQQKVATTSESPAHTSYLNRVHQSLKKIIFNNDFSLDAEISQELEDFIEKFQPEVVYTILGSLPQIRLIKKITQKYKIPYVVHMMDDWPNMLYKEGLFNIYRRQCMAVELQEIMNNAALCLGICDYMSREFSERYKVPYPKSFHNALNIHEWGENSRKNWKAGTPTLAYGPKEVASISYAEDYKWAHCVTDRNEDQLNSAIKELAINQTLREKLAKRAQEVARERHNQKNVSEQLHHSLAQAAKAGIIKST